MKWYQYLFSLTNTNRHKVFMLCGIKIKLKKTSINKYLIENSNIQNENYYNQVFSKIETKTYDINSLDIAFIVPQPIKGSGGHRNIYRAVRFLNDYGHKITVYYTQTRDCADTVKSNVSKWFYDMLDIPFICYEGEIGYHDACIATWWETAYDLKHNLHKIKFPFYMVQDYEPYFSPMSSNYVLAENTYKFGFKHICSGPWCKNFLVNKYNARAEYFQFPVDTTVYNKSKARTKINKNIIFFAKPEMPRRCYELGIKALEEFHKIKPDVEIVLFGSNNVKQEWLPFKATILNLLPTLNDLADIYRNADLGIVFSTTNPSLVPYEMISCGCPVVDLNLDHAITKYGNDENNAFLLNPEPEIFARELSEIIDNQELLHKKSIFSNKWVSNEFPTEQEMGKVYERIIKNYVLEDE